MRLRFILLILSILALLSITAGGYFYHTSLRDAFFNAANQADVSHVNTINTLISQHIYDYTRLVNVMSTLSVVWGMVKDHGGYIDVTSREGE